MPPDPRFFVLGKDMLHSYSPVYMPAAGTAERGMCVPRG